jgi:hypothetical protein
MSWPNIELLKRAREILATIPAPRLNLSVVALNNEDGACNDPNHCGTIACGLGWLAMRPEFQALGLGVDDEGRLLWNRKFDYFGTVAAKLFNMTEEDAGSMFCLCMTEERMQLQQTGADDVRDHAVLMWRMDKFIAKHEGARA